MLNDHFQVVTIFKENAWTQGTSTLRSHDKTENNAEQCQLIKKRVNIGLKMTTAENNLFGNVNRLQE